MSRYVYLTYEEANGIRHGKQKEIDFITVQKLILEDTNRAGGALAKVHDLAKFGWVTLKNGVIEHRKN